ncbi:hypothetical protein BH20ACT5_BH20ACT5_19710 [soil metagenome]
MKPGALIVDYGGVLTTPLSATVDPWLAAERIPPERFRALMRQWFAPDAAPSIAHDLEMGRLGAADFAPLFAAELRRADGTLPEHEGLLERMFAGFTADPAMLDVVRAAKRHGLRTALLSNSWGFDYPREGWAELFDAVVVSGEVGMRKPEPEIYRHTAAELGLDPGECVFVDDLRPNVAGAVAAGMIGVRHRDALTTAAELAAIFDLPFT